MPKSYSILKVILSSVFLVATSHSQQNATLRSVQWTDPSYDKHAQHEYDSGYKDGSHSGLIDARQNRGFILYEHGAYRDHRDRMYREGYERGYREAFQANVQQPEHNRDSGNGTTPELSNSFGRQENSSDE